MIIRADIRAADLDNDQERFWRFSGEKILRIRDDYDAGAGSPVFTVNGRYTSRGWTEWTQGFLFGSALLQYDAVGDDEFLTYGLENTRRLMAPHLTHFGVHDHGFNNVSTYGNLLRLMDEGRISGDPWAREFAVLALKASGAVQAYRWTDIGDGKGFIYSFNGPHSLFADTIRSLRSLALAYRLGHRLLAEGDREIPLLGRLIGHARTTAEYNVYYGEGRDIYDVRGRVAHESIFNTVDGAYRCPSTQQGYSPYSTWTRGLGWILLGYAEQLEFVDLLSPAELAPYGGTDDVNGFMLRAARATADFFIENTPVDGVPYWDTGAPGLARLGDVLSRPADPFNGFEPVDSSAAAITAQGLLRLGRFLSGKGDADGRRYFAAGLTVLSTLLQEPYLSTAPDHHGLLLHSVYHRPRGWDHVPDGADVPAGESSMWGDYHIREAALLARRIARKEPALTFFLP